jgi:hypothetical protein
MPYTGADMFANKGFILSLVSVHKIFTGAKPVIVQAINFIKFPWVAAFNQEL